MRCENMKLCKDLPVQAQSERCFPTGMFGCVVVLVVKTFKERQQLHDKKGSWILWKKSSFQIKSLWNMKYDELLLFWPSRRDFVDCHCYAQATKYHGESINHITIFMITWVLWGTMNNWLITYILTIAWDMLRSRLL